MPIAQDAQNLIDTITLSNLSNLNSPNPTLIIPPGLADFYISTIQNNLANPLLMPADIQQLVKTLITNNQVTIIEA